MNSLTTEPRAEPAAVPAQSQRPRRLRASAALREMVAEGRVHPAQLVMPAFVIPGHDRREPIAALPGIARFSADRLLREVEGAMRLGVRGTLLFGVPDGPGDALGTAAWEGEPLVAAAVRALKRAFGSDLVVMTDVCLCAYTDHGHCGVVRDGAVDNDETLPLLARMALAHARAGADFVAPSDMMDGRVGALRAALDAAGETGAGILSYAVKYASAYYGPFREAAHSAPAFGDRRTYQMDPRNVREAAREARLDEAEGADMLMVKPALPCLDVIRAVREASALPLAAYNVSGEYAMVKAAAAAGWVDEGAVVRENLQAMVRAGAGILITYHAVEALREGWIG